MDRSPLATVRKEFTAFRNESVWIQTCFNNFNALFSNQPEAENTIREWAPLFFADLNRALIECWISAVCRVTDPARTGTRATGARVTSAMDFPFPIRLNFHKSILVPGYRCRTGEVPSYSLKLTRYGRRCNPLLKLTRYGRLCKPGPRQSYYRREPGLQTLPPRAA